MFEPNQKERHQGNRLSLLLRQGPVQHDRGNRRKRVLMLQHQEESAL